MLYWCRTVIPIGVGLAVLQAHGYYVQCCALVRSWVYTDFLLGISIIGVIGRIVVNRSAVFRFVISPAQRVAHVFSVQPPFTQMITTTEELLNSCGNYCGDIDIAYAGIDLSTFYFYEKSVIWRCEKRSPNLWISKPLGMTSPKGFCHSGKFSKYTAKKIKTSWQS